MALMLQKLNEIRGQFGVTAAMQFVADRLAKRLAGLQVSRILWLRADALPAARPLPEGFVFRFLEPAEVERYALDSANELDGWLVERAWRGHDLCFAALAGDRLASYGWYALGSIEPAQFFQVGMSYPDDVAYMYAGFTHPDFRGQRLHAIGMELALRALAEHGVYHLVSYVDWINWPSLRSCQRLGYEDLGAMLTGRVGPWGFGQFPPQATRRGVRFGRMADHRRRQTPAHSNQLTAV
jgi:hypothetical protein